VGSFSGSSTERPGVHKQPSPATDPSRCTWESALAAKPALLPDF